MRCRRLLGLLLALLAGAGLCAETWVEARSPHFVAYSDAGPDEARRVLRLFEEIRLVFLHAFPKIRVDAPRPTILIAVGREDAMRRLLPAPFEGPNPKRPAGSFLTRGERNYAILRLDAGQEDQGHATLFHEFTHGVLHMNFPALPTWLDEGIADYYGHTQIQSRRVVLGRIPQGHLELLRHSAMLPLEDLFRVTQASPHYREGDKAGLFYAQSWALVHRLYMDPAVEGQLRAYLQGLEAGQDSVKAGRSAFGDLERALGQLTTYTRQPRFRIASMDLRLQADDSAFAVRTLDAVEADLLQAEFLQYGGQEPLARPLVARALAQAPERPEVQVAVGYGHHLRGEAEAAAQAFEQALRLGSRDFRAPYLLALGAPRRTRAEAGADQTLAWIEAALALRPDFPSALVLRCQALALRPGREREALEAGQRALELDPLTLSHLANVGSACLAMGREGDALALRDTLTARARRPEEKAMAERFAESVAEHLRQQREAEARARTKPALPPGAVVGAPAPGAPRPLRFQLPDHLSPLGREVLTLWGQGRTREALAKVEAALARAQYDYDRKALRALAEQLRSRLREEPPRP